MTQTQSINISGVPETMLWTLHNRASEAKRRDAILQDPDALRIYAAISYDYTRSFGGPDGSHAMRSRIFDDAVRPWLASHRGGTVVELGCGLETQFQRCDDGCVRWLCVDVLEAIAIRERFLPPTERCRHVARSVLDSAWMEEIDPARGVFVTAQGLFMYFDEDAVRRLVTSIFERIPGVTLMFDGIPRWFSKKTLRGYHRTKHYTAPPMPWGINGNEVEPLLRGWSRHVRDVTVVPYGPVHGTAGFALSVLSRVPVIRHMTPFVVLVNTEGTVIDQ